MICRWRAHDFKSPLKQYDVEFITQWISLLSGLIQGYEELTSYLITS
jgi:hypothetical protein